MCLKCSRGSARDFDLDNGGDLLRIFTSCTVLLYSMYLQIRCIAILYLIFFIRSSYALIASLVPAITNDFVFAPTPFFGDLHCHPEPH